MAEAIVDGNGDGYKLKVNSDGSIDVNADLEVSDLQIGAVEIKNGTTDDRAVVDTNGNLSTIDFSKLVPKEHDEIALTYVSAGNGVGEIETVVYKLASATVATLTLSYDSNNRLSGVVKS